jgi:pimeloyl-ACP methyl ester carboxylesterase
MSTAFIARDMMQIVDALGEDGLLRYYGQFKLHLRYYIGLNEIQLGFSYGTVLGATVAAMFPDRMDKIVLDGVVNIHEWLYGRYLNYPLLIPEE